MRTSLAPGSLAVLLVCLSLPAQAELELFDRTFETLRASSPPASERLARSLSDQFLRLEQDSPGRRARLGKGLEALVRAGRTELAVDIAATLGAEDLAPDDVTRWHLIALVRTDRLAEFATGMVAARARRQDVVVDEVLRAEEGRLVPLADRALRRGELLGRDVFTALAALKPPQAIRYANLGLCLRNLGALEAAEGAYARAVALAPNDAGIENDRGLLLRATGRPDEARAAFGRSYTLDAEAGTAPGSGPAITNLLHFEALVPAGQTGAPMARDPLPLAGRALAVRPAAAMLRRLVLDVTLDRLVRPRPAGPTSRDR